MNLLLEQLIREAGDLPPMPQAAQRALALIRNPESSMTEVAATLSVDQALSSLTLRLANSAYYGMASRVATVQQAVMVLGANTMRDMLLTSSVTSYLNRPLPGYDLKRGDLWRHSLGVAIGARRIYEQRKLPGADEAYFAGLLSDIGKLAFEKLLRPIDSNQPDWRSGSFLDVERMHFGVDHAMLGAELARRWRLPENLIDAIAFHHTPASATDNLPIVSAVHIADAAMMMLGIGMGKDGLRYPLDPVATDCLKFTEKDMYDLMEFTTTQIKLSELYINGEAASRA
ncbi:MAG: HDOD domain-containing protein [Anaerolineae bacterium]|nr:HDOD domain-containing protein [Anaerolineae bacterium]